MSATNNNLALPSSSRNRCYWVVSPNVRPKENIEKWKEASFKHRAAFMGWGARELGHSQIGPKFAGKTKPHIRGIKPDDIILIARRFNKEAETVGFGIVRGKNKTRHLEHSSDIVSIRNLSKFKRCARPPAGIPLIRALQHTRALVQLHPDQNPVHEKICKWLDRQLDNKPHPPPPPDAGIRLGDPPKNHKSGYEVQKRSEITKADKIEAELLEGYRDWLKKKSRKLKVLNYGKRLQCDGYEEKTKNLIEAKSSTRREHIRMAVGQLLDYAFLGRENEKFCDPNIAILLPKKPRPDIVKWLQYLKISVIWRARKSFLDNANRRFS